MDAASPQPEPLDDPAYIPSPHGERPAAEGDYDNDQGLVASGSKRSRSSKARLPRSSKRRHIEDSEHPDLPPSNYATDLATALFNDPTDVPASQQTISLSRGIEEGTDGGVEALRKEVSCPEHASTLL
jgi:hypothetical protein